MAVRERTATLALFHSWEGQSWTWSLC